MYSVHGELPLTPGSREIYDLQLQAPLIMEEDEYIEYAANNSLPGNPNTIRSEVKEMAAIAEVLAEWNTAMLTGNLPAEDKKVLQRHIDEENRRLNDLYRKGDAQQKEALQNEIQRLDSIGHTKGSSAATQLLGILFPEEQSIEELVEDHFKGLDAVEDEKITGGIVPGSIETEDVPQAEESEGEEEKEDIQYLDAPPPPLQPSDQTPFEYFRSLNRSEPVFTPTEKDMEPRIYRY